MRSVDVSEQTYSALSELKGAMMSFDEAISRLITRWNDPETVSEDKLYTSKPEVPRVNGVGVDGLREPRQRGVTVEIADQRVVASSVRDLYEQALRHLVDGGILVRHASMIPFRTSAARYLVAKSPEHPAGNDFVVPVKYGGYYIEAHKSYRTALKQLAMLLAKMGVTFRYVGV